MNRASIRRVKQLCAELAQLCDAAEERINQERQYRGYSTRAPSDHSYGSPQTAALRRRSMDLTRALAELRKPA